MSATRILLVGPAGISKPSYGPWTSSRSGLMFYDMRHRLANGFVRNGHFVFTMNDRDSRKQCLGVWPAAAWHANRRLLHLARELQPNLLCLHHCDLIRSETVHRIREMVPGCRVAVVYYDAVQSPSSVRRLRPGGRRFRICDLGRLRSIRARRNLPNCLHPKI